MNFKHFLWVAAFALAFTACDNDDDINGSESSVGKILFSTTVTNPSGDSGSGYLQAVGSLEGGTHYNNSNAIPLGFGRIPASARVATSICFPTIWAVRN